MMRTIDKFLNRITTYRLVLYSLLLLAVLALGLSAADIISYSSFSTLFGMFGLLGTVCLVTNWTLSKLYSVTTSQESWGITALILFFILSAPASAIGWAGVAFAGVVAMASKFVLTWRSSNVFNPAALAVLVVALMGIGDGAWWVANTALFWPMLVIGFLILKKLRRFTLFAAFVVPAISFIVFKNIDQGLAFSEAITAALTLYPVLFLGTIMLTEPATMPGTNTNRLVFGALVGVLFGSQVDFGFIQSTPHLSLLVGNIFALLVTFRPSTRLVLVKKTQLSPTTYDFAFKSNRSIRQLPGQYMEFTLPHVRLDARGNRHTFSIASAPRSELLHLGIKFYQPGSAYKQRLLELKPGDTVFANRLAGDFILPDKPKKPMVFVAGGIGVTPFISMIQHVLMNKQKCDITLYYFTSDASEIVYKDILLQAKSAGIVVVQKLGREAKLTDEEIKSHQAAEFYLSGPPGFVDAYKKQLRLHGIRSVRTDYFSDY